MTEDEYLAFERASEAKHEYVDGAVYAMAGASLEHTTIVGNLVTLLNNALAAGPCLVSASDLRLKIASERASYRYPDISVICEPPKITGENPGTLLNPTVLIEVVSGSTAATDRGHKLHEYLRVPSLRAYLLVEQTQARVERYLKAADWLYTDATGLDATLSIPTLDCTVSLADVYRKVTFDA